MLPLSKPKCLNLLLNAKPLRRYGLDAAAKFVEKFPWRGFLVQAPQAIQSLTGYGLVLGGLMGAAVDTFWGLVRAPWNGLPRLDLPSAVDPVSKAIKHLVTSPWHYTDSALLSFEDHYLLTAADAAAVAILAPVASVDLVEQRYEEFAALPVVQFNPTNPLTIEVLREEGIDPFENQGSLIPGLDEFATYADVYSAVLRGFPDWLEKIRLDFPRSTSANAFCKILSDGGHDFFTWSTRGEDHIKPIFEPEELAFARMFEYGVFPPEQPTAIELEVFLERAIELAHSAGREIPSLRDVVEALDDVFGGHVQR